MMVTRFWNKVERRGQYECWPWIGARGNNGRGQLWINGRKWPAPRIAWWIEHGTPPPEHLLVCHTCDNPPCVNPAHLWLGTKKDNAVDAANKGRICSIGRSRITHCWRGHEYAGENLFIRKNGNRQCRACATERWKRNEGRRWPRVR
jgi:hypothetical protein